MSRMIRLSLSKLIISLIIFSCFFKLTICWCYAGNDLGSAFYKAAENQDITLMQKLIEKGADVNYAEQREKFTALTIAAGCGNVEMVNFLLKNGANVVGFPGRPNQPIYYAIVNNYPYIVDILIKNGVDPNFTWPNSGGTLLTNAVQFGYLEIVKLLVNKGADVNFCGNGNFSPLYRSIIYDEFDVLKYLINKNANLNDKDILALRQLGWFKMKEYSYIITLLELKGVIDKNELND